MRSNPWLRLAVTVATVGGLMATGSGPASAATVTPTVSYSPSTNLRDGQTTATVDVATILNDD